MSFSDKFPDWSVFPEREEVSLDTELLSPAAEVANSLRKQQAALGEAEQLVQNERRKWLDALAQQAALVGQLTLILDRYEAEVAQASPQTSQTLLSKFYRSLRLMKDRMLDALRSAGLSVQMPLGKSFDEVSELVQVVGWRHHQDFTSEVVAAVLEPVVCYGETVVRLGQVEMGAPLEEAIETVPTYEIEKENGERTA